MSSDDLQLKPFVKWVGGKTQVLDVINILKPKIINKFIEPFVGGGAVFFNIAHQKAVINDINKELINAYEIIKTSHKELKVILNKWNNFADLKIFYDELRTKDSNHLAALEQAARLIFLNKYGFNGLYRVNSKGKFNVPFGKKNKISLYDSNNLNNIAKYLNENEIIILNNNYEELLEFIEKDDFLFVDPPYYFEDNKGFNAYDSNKFTAENQKQLFNFLELAGNKGAKWILTNNDNNFIRELYQDYTFFSKKTNRFINSNGEKRIDAAQEIFIYNYKISEQTKKDLEFISFCDTFIATNIKLDNLVDWNKIEDKMLQYEYDLSIFNFLYSKNEDALKEKLTKYWEQHLDSFEKLYMLLAVRENNTFLHNKNNPFFKTLNFQSPAEIIDFLKSSSLIKLFIGNNYLDFRTYMRGLEVGMDVNARKNRFGKIMENNITQILVDNNIKFERNIIIDISKQDGVSQENKKNFDFKFTKNNKDYYLECNFYNASGSKLNEVTKSYIAINNLLKQKKLNFVWVTDGEGWKKTRSSLKTAFLEIENIFSIELFKKWITSL